MKHWLAATLALCLSGCAIAPAGTDAEARGRELLGQMKAAMGGPALDAPSGFHETGISVRDDGAKMTYETWGDLRSFKSASLQTVDGRQTRAGFDGESAWHVLPNGEVQRDTDAHTLFVVNMATYLSVGGYFHPDRFQVKVKYLGRDRPEGETSGERWDVVEVWPEKTLPINLWLDPQTHRLERISGKVSSDETFTTILDDYRQVDGVSVAFTAKQIDEEHTVTQTTASHTFGPVPPERFMQPKAR
ncbi:MAG: hypothetical protein ABI740_00660 [Alphaproteobacteria bacterium]